MADVQTKLFSTGLESFTFWSTNTELLKQFEDFGEAILLPG
jgi:hypothetical protein